MNVHPLFCPEIIDLLTNNRVNERYRLISPVIA
jgi:hypothetical protein